MNPETNLSKKVTALKMELERKTQELGDKKAQNLELEKKYRLAIRALFDKDDTIDSLKNDITKLLNFWNHNNRDIEVEECKRQMQRSIENLTTQTFRLESEVQNLSESNDKLLLENANLKDILNQRTSHLAEMIISKNFVQDYPIIKHENNQMDEEMPQEISDDYRTNMERIVLSNHDDDEEYEEEQSFPESLPESINGFQQFPDSERELLHIKDETEVDLEVPLIHKSKKNRKGQHRTVYQRFSNEEDNCLLDLIFNSKPEVKTLVRRELWRRASDALIKVDGNDRHFSSVKSRLMNSLVETLHRREELNTEKHRRIAKLCYESSFKDDRQKYEKYMEMYDRAREEGFVKDDKGALLKNRKPQPRRKGIGGEEMDQIVHYIFNICPPVRSFGDTYWLSLSIQLKNDEVTSRSMASLRKSFYEKIMFDLYKIKDLNTDEHRKIAVMAFQMSGQKFHKELTEQYDRARLPDTTHEEIAQLESLAWKKKAEATKRSTRSAFTYKLFSEEENDHLIKLVFEAQVNEPEERKSTKYWEKINENFAKHIDHPRSCRSLKNHFQNRLLETLHDRRELTTLEHRQVAVELYNLWFESDISKHHIRLYDFARRSPDAEGQ